MTNPTFNSLASVLSTIATYATPAEVEVTRQLSTLARSNIPKSRVDEAVVVMGRVKKEEMDAVTNNGQKRGASLADELSENSVFRILWTESQGECLFWNNIKKNVNKKDDICTNYQKQFGFSGTPDFMYKGVPADAFSVKVSEKEKRDIGVVRTCLLHTLVQKIYEKWRKYGSHTIAVADISTWPQFIRTHKVAQHVIANCKPLQQQKVFLVRSRIDMPTKLMKILM